MARLIAHWQRHGHNMEVPQAYWDQCHTLPQRQGPIQLLKHLLIGYGIQPAGPFHWTLEDTTHAVDTAPDLLGTMLRQVRRTLWGKLALQEHYRGLGAGRNETATNS